MEQKNIQRHIDDIAAYGPWFYKHYQARFLPWHTQVQAVQKMQQAYPWAIRHCGTVGTPEGMQPWMWSQKELDKTREQYIQRVCSDHTFLDTMETTFLTAWDIFLNQERLYAQQEHQLSLLERITAFVALSDAETDAAQHAYINDCFLTTGGSDWLLSWLEKEVPPSTPDRPMVIEQLAVPARSSFVQDEATDLLRIAAAPEADRQQLLQQHAQEWYWVENSYIESSPLQETDFQKKIEQLQKQGDVGERLQSAAGAEEMKRQGKTILLNSIDALQQLRAIVNLSDRISHLTDLRKMGVLRINHWTWKLLREIEQETGVPFTTSVWSRQLELQDAVQSNDWSLMEQRKKTGNLTLVANGEWESYAGETLQSLHIKPLLPNVEASNSVRGQTAYPGIVEGIAKVIRGRSDFDQFESGDILITNQTTPEFVPLMKRARAVVTEQGGITCHAAIISRELQIPCVIGTQSAMSIFLSGDQIVVDATAGEVRKKR